jgi:hypothetical protein
MITDEDQKQKSDLWAAIDQHQKDAATLFLRLPEGTQSLYLSLAIGAWERASKAPITRELLATMVIVLFSDDERGEHVLDSLDDYREQAREEAS